MNVLWQGTTEDRRALIFGLGSIQDVQQSESAEEIADRPAGRFASPPWATRRSMATSIGPVAWGTRERHRSRSLGLRSSWAHCLGERYRRHQETCLRFDEFARASRGPRSQHLRC